MFDGESTELDPFTLTYNALWNAAESNPSLQQLVRSGNRIKFVNSLGDMDPRKTTQNYGTTPELMLVPDYFTGELIVDNVQGRVTRVWNWVIRTEHRLLNKALFPVEYALLKAMQIEANQILYNLKFNGSSLISYYNVDRGSANIPEMGESKNSPTGAWYSIWSVRTDLNILH